MSAPAVRSGPALPVGRRRRRRAPARPGTPLPRPAVARIALLVAGAGLGATTALTFTAETAGQLRAPGGLATFAGSLTGMIGTYLALMMVLLISRIPMIERVLGQDGLVRWHRRLAPWPISLLVTHAVFITVGAAQAARNGLGREVGVMLTRFPDVLIATIGLGIMCLIGVISLRAIRSRLSREAWWLVHLYIYLALALSFAHVIVLGPSFVGHPLTRAVWSLAWAATAGLVLVYRFGLPVARSLRHRLVVTEVRPEGPGVVSVICAGRQLDKLPVDGGQFMFWRFLTPGTWWQAHPFSLSALPRPPYVRLTVKALGAYSASLAHLRPGTRVMVEGPYGAFTRNAQVRPGALLVAAGIGVTALRSLLEDLPRNCAPVVLLRAGRRADLVLGQEVFELVRDRGGRLHALVGDREQARIDERSLHQLVPDLEHRDVFVCGPEGSWPASSILVKRLGVPDEAIHHEAFAL